MRPRPVRLASPAWPLALALLAAGCGGKPATPDTAEVITKATPPEPSPAPSPAPAPEPAPAAPAPAEAKP